MSATEIYKRYEARVADDPDGALAEALAGLEGVAPEARVAPPLWILKLVDGRLPVEALRLVEGLRVFDLLLDEHTARPLRGCGARVQALQGWLQALPDDPALSVTHLDLGRQGWDAGPGGAWIPVDFSDFDGDVALAVLRSPLAPRLRALNLASGPWPTRDLYSHDAYLDAERVNRCFLSGLYFEDLLDLPCARTLERLDVDYADLRLVDYDDSAEGPVPLERARLPALRHLGAARCRYNTHGALLHALVARGELPKLETLDLRDDFSPLAQQWLREGDEDDLVWLHHDYGACLEGIRGHELAALAEAPPSLREVAFGGAIERARALLAEQGVTPHFKLVRALDMASSALPW